MLLYFNYISIFLLYLSISLFFLILFFNNKNKLTNNRIKLIFIIIQSIFYLSCLVIFLLMFFFKSEKIFIFFFLFLSTLMLFIALFYSYEFYLRKKDKKIVDYDLLINEMLLSFEYFSRKKIGALVTFEKQDNLTQHFIYVKNGIVINSLVTKELLMTIFFPGTYLHDGAVIIKNNFITMANVMYPNIDIGFSLNKYGSRHRAAIAISKKSDSLTVVVSEESGNISIAYKGRINVLSIEELSNVLRNFLIYSKGVFF